MFTKLIGLLNFMKTSINSKIFFFKYSYTLIKRRAIGYFMKTDISTKIFFFKYSYTLIKRKAICYFMKTAISTKIFFFKYSYTLIRPNFVFLFLYIKAVFLIVFSLKIFNNFLIQKKFHEFHLKKDDNFSTFYHSIYFQRLENFR